MPDREWCPVLRSRREWLRRSSAGFGLLALRGLLAEPKARADQKRHHPAKAKSVIFCFMDGGPSHVDTFDPKPALTKYGGKAIGAAAVSKRSQSDPNRVWMPSPWKFAQRGKSGLWVSDLFPHLAVSPSRGVWGVRPISPAQSTTVVSNSPRRFRSAIRAATDWSVIMAFWP